MDEIIELFIPTPKAKTSMEKILIFLLGSVLVFGAFIIAGFMWYIYDWFYGAVGLLLGYLLLGILSSKIRQYSVPSTQWEHKYNGYELARWYIYIQL